jgi:hypothetical protein
MNAYIRRFLSLVFPLALIVMGYVQLSVSGPAPSQASALAVAKSVSVTPGSGRAGSYITVSGAGYACSTTCNYGVYMDGATLLGNFSSSSFQITVSIPANATPGCHSITTRLLAAGSPELASATFTVEDTLPPREVARRRALELLEEARHTGMAPNWNGLDKLGTEVRELYRPDVAGVAYYEFPVVKPLLSSLIASGFIIVSTACHDYLIPHWNFRGLPPTKVLDSEARQLGQPAPAKYFKLDSLTYAAEDAAGNRVATSIPLPVKVTGVDPVWLNLQNQPLSSVDWVVPDGTVLFDDSQAASAPGYYVKSGPGWPSSLVLSGWGSWQSLKNEYAQNYSVYLESLRRASRDDWVADLRRALYGRALTAKQAYSLPLLLEPSGYWFSGPGIGSIKSHAVVQRSGQLPLLKIEVTDVAPPYDQSLVVHISYRVLFATFTEQRTLLIIGASTPPPPTTGAPYSPQHEHWWAGSEADQRIYDQIPTNIVTPDGYCMSGCGATAWAMLFGWADHKAWLGDPVWRPRWGIYREKGGRGPDADAPRNMDDGVENMTLEIRGHIDTFCSPIGKQTNGATYPSDMGEVGGYLNGRTRAEAQTRYNAFSWHEDRIRDRATGAIKGEQSGGAKPVIVGQGFFEHYALAWGYARHKEYVKNAQFNVWYEHIDRRYYINKGWGGIKGDGWVKAGFWLAGTVTPD